MNHHDPVQDEDSIGGAFWAISRNVNPPFWLVLENRGDIQTSRAFEYI
jgi:hypothetical protein